MACAALPSHSDRSLLRRARRGRLHQSVIVKDWCYCINIINTLSLLLSSLEILRHSLFSCFVFELKPLGVFF